MSEIQIDSTLKTKSEADVLHLGTAKENGKKFWYVGEQQHFDDLTKEIFEMKAYDSVLTKKDMVIVDAGAYIGDTAYIFHDFAKKIYAIEPNSMAFEAMKRNIKLHNLDKVVPIGKGLMARTGKFRLYVTGNDTTGASPISFLASNKGWTGEAISFDDLCTQYEIDHIDLLKMDIEGAEYEVLRSEGFAKMAERIDTIILESHPFYIPPGEGGTIWEIPYLLSKFGFITKELHQPVVYHVKIRFADGFERLVPMSIFIARREGK